VKLQGAVGAIVVAAMALGALMATAFGGVHPVARRVASGHTLADVAPTATATVAVGAPAPTPTVRTAVTRRAAPNGEETSLVEAAPVDVAVGATPTPTSTPTPTPIIGPLPSVVAVAPDLGTSTASTASTSNGDHPTAKGLLVFDDEFGDDAPTTTTTGSVDGTKWMTCYPWWGLAPTGCTNHGNPEQEWYVPQQVRVSEGALHLVAERADTQGTDRNGNPTTYPYRSGIVTSARRFSFTYGYVELRARIPRGQAMWPALWLLPTDYSWPPEIDAMEATGSNTTSVALTMHGTDGSAPQQLVGGTDFATGWHTFGVDWRKDAITWYVDGTSRFTVTKAIPDVPMYLIANLAVGGAAGPVTADSPAVATFDVDYVKVWQQQQQRA
jgi:beta-glucanase (GH16 family)